MALAKRIPTLYLLRVIPSPHVAMTLDTPTAELPPRAPRRRWWIAGIGGAALAAAGAVFVTSDVRVADVEMPWTSLVRDAGIADALALQLSADSAAAVIQSAALTVDAVSPLVSAAAVRAFYDARDGAPAWTAPADRDAAIRLLSRADRDGLPVVMSPEITDLAAQAAAPDSLRARLDARLTAAVLAFGERLRTPRADALALYGANAWEPAVHAPANLADDARDLAADLDAADDATSALGAFADRHRPGHAGYANLRRALAREIDLAAAPDLTIADDLTPGDSGAAVQTLRARLAIEDAATPARGTYDDALATTVRDFQTAQGLPETGRTDAATRAALNRRQPNAIPAIVLNMERWRWMPDSLGALHVFVNIPEYRLALRETDADGTRDLFSSVVVVGQPSWATPVFSDTMETVVFNPTWTMPASIQRESYGRLRPDRAVRPPGPGNALGRVKFLFPNRHAVYFHDTPSKWGFSVERRALSHGCVRVGSPRDFAEAVLSRTNRWDAARVDSVITGPWTTRDVALAHKIPVHIAYFTASADAAGRVTTFPDVYSRDPRLADALGLTPATPTIVAATVTNNPLQNG